MNYTEAVNFLTNYFTIMSRLMVHEGLRRQMNEAIEVLKSMEGYDREKTDLPAVRQFDVPEWVDNSRKH